MAHTIHTTPVNNVLDESSPDWDPNARCAAAWIDAPRQILVENRMGLVAHSLKQEYKDIFFKQATDANRQYQRICLTKSEYEEFARPQPKYISVYYGSKMGKENEIMFESYYSLSIVNSENDDIMGSFPKIELLGHMVIVDESDNESIEYVFDILNNLMDNNKYDSSKNGLFLAILKNKKDDDIAVYEKVIDQIDGKLNEQMLKENGSIFNDVIVINKNGQIIENDCSQFLADIKRFGPIMYQYAPKQSKPKAKPEGWCTIL